MTTPQWWRHAVVGAAWFAVLAMVVGSFVAGHDRDAPEIRAAAALNAIGALSLLLRRRSPVGVLAVVVAVTATTTLLTTTFAHRGSELLVVLALYVVATQRPPRQAISAAVASEIVIAGATGLRDAAVLQDLGALVSQVAFFAAALAIGIAVRSQRSLLQSFRARAEQAEREQRWGSARAVAAERVRIARELHDVVAHHVSLLVVQAGAVRETLPDHHVTRPVLDSMVDGGRRAMGELRDMLGALRFDDPLLGHLQTPAAAPGAVHPGETLDEPAPLAPQPTVEQLPELVDGARVAGLPVNLQVGEGGAAIPPVVSLSVYRIVQEALTNAVKHAPGAQTTAIVAFGSDSVEVTVHNGPSPMAGAVSTTPDARPDQDHLVRGHGITGMAERAALVHGTLCSGPVGEGWEVRARLPLDPDVRDVLV